MLLGALLLGEGIGLSVARATPLATIRSVVISDNAAWMGPGPTATNGSLTLDVGDRLGTPAPDQPYGVDSSDPQVAAVTVQDRLLTLSFAGEGVATVSVTSGDLTDQFQVSVYRMGDINGDGLLTPADALYIQQVVKGTVTPAPADLKRLDLTGDGAVTSADASKAMNLYLAQGKGTTPLEYDVVITDVNDAPVAHFVTLSGQAEVGGTLTGSYYYADVEGDAESTTVMQWYRSLSADGANRSEIAGATGSSYTASIQDRGYYLFYGVTPVAATGTAQGATVFSAPSGLVPPVLLNAVPESTPTLSESDLTASVLVLSASGDQFLESLTDADFTLNGAPVGLSIALATVVDGKAYLLLDFDGTNFDVDHQLTVTAKPSAFAQGSDPVTSNPVLIEAVNPGAFISEYLQKNVTDVALELFANPGSRIGLQVEMHQWLPTEQRSEVATITVRDLWSSSIYVIINSTYYTIADDMGDKWIGYNDELWWAKPDRFTYAIVLKQNGKVQDVLGNPNSSSPQPLVPNGGTLVRQSTVKGGAPVYRTHQWTPYNPVTWDYFMRHTQQ